MDAISDGAVESVVIMSSAQVGKSEALGNSVGYYIDQDPAPIMLVMPTERDAEAWSKDRFSPMARDTPCLAGKISDPKSRDGSNKILHKRFPGGHLTIVGANAPSGLASRPIRILLCDEVDRYPFSAGAEGDPVNLAKKRTVTFWNRKIVLVSTPTIRGAEPDRDRLRRERPAAVLGAVPGLRRAAGAGLGPGPLGQRAGGHAGGEHRPETARYHCAACDAAWSDALRWAAIRRGEWRARAPFRGIAGFHLNEIYSSWVRLEAMVRAFLSARAGGDEAMKTFVNTSLGETWMESGEAPDWRRLYDRRERWPAGTVPEGGLILTAGADVQKDRIEVDVWAWGRGLESWLVDHVVIEGGPESEAAWAALAALLGRTWPHALGAELQLARLADRHRLRGAGGLCLGAARRASRRWRRSRASRASAGRARCRGRPMSMRPKAASGSAAAPGSGPWRSRPSRPRPTASCGWSGRPTRRSPAARGCRPARSTCRTGSRAEWLKQFVAEQLVTVKTKRGFARLEWQKLRERNEALDTRVYARAAAWIAGLDRWSEERWAEAEREVSVERAPAARPTRAPAQRTGADELAGRLARPPEGLAQVRRPTR